MRTVVITGGTGWLGQALASRLLRDEDIRLGVTYLMPREAERFEDLFGTFHRRIILRRVDVVKPGVVEGFFSEVSETWGDISGLACLAGSWAGGRSVEETSDLRLERMLDSNLR